MTLSPPSFHGLTGFRMKLVVLLLLLALFLAYLLPSIVVTIGSGQMGVKWYRFRGGTDLGRVYGEGTQAIYPWDAMALYDMRLQDMQGRVEALTVDGLKVSLDITARFAIRADGLAQLHQAVGPDYKARIVWPDVEAAVRRVIRQFHTEDLRPLGEADLPGLIDDAARQAIGGRWIVLDRVLVTRIALPQRIESEIEDKLAQEQKVLAYTHVLRQTELERQRRLIEADTIREFEKRSRVSYLQWRGLETTDHLAASPNSKVVVLGSGTSPLPLIVGNEK